MNRNSVGCPVFGRFRGRPGDRVAAFFVTTVYKLVQGVDQAPFPGGLFPVFSPPPGHPAYREGVGEVIPAPREMIIMQITANTLGVLAGITDIVCDVTVLDEYFEHPWLLQMSGINVFCNIFAFVAGNCPPVVGVTWGADNGLWAGTFAVTTAYTLLQISTIIAFLRAKNRSVFDTPILKNIGGGFGGPIISFAFNATALGLSSAAVAIAEEPVSAYTKAATVMQFIPGVLPIFRIKLPSKILPPEQTFKYRAVAVCMLDAALAIGSSLMGLIASCAELSDRPDVLPGQNPVAVATRESTYQVVAKGGRQAWNSPLKEREVEYDEAAGTVTIDKDGLITATWKDAGQHAVTVTCKDSYIPSQKSDPGTVIFTVNSALAATPR